MAEVVELKHMILSFRVSELQQLLSLLGRSKTGKKQELLQRALSLLRNNTMEVRQAIQQTYRTLASERGFGGPVMDHHLQQQPEQQQQQQPQQHHRSISNYELIDASSSSSKRHLTDDIISAPAVRLDRMHKLVTASSASSSSRSAESGGGGGGGRSLRARHRPGFYAELDAKYDFTLVEASGGVPESSSHRSSSAAAAAAHAAASSASIVEAPTSPQLIQQSSSQSSRSHSHSSTTRGEHSSHHHPSSHHRTQSTSNQNPTSPTSPSSLASWTATNQPSLTALAQEARLASRQIAALTAAAENARVYSAYNAAAAAASTSSSSGHHKKMMSPPPLSSSHHSHHRQLSSSSSAAANLPVYDYKQYSSSSSSSAHHQSPQKYSSATSTSSSAVLSGSSAYHQSALFVGGCPQLPVHPDVRLKRLPFYDILGNLLKPTSLLPKGNSKYQEAYYIFHLTPQQATEISQSRCDVSRPDFQVQVLMRFCLTETTSEQDDMFPNSIGVRVNGKPAPLPNLIPSNRPGVEPKRPNRPVNITAVCRISPTVSNRIDVSWAAEIGRSFCISVDLVRCVTAETLLQRLRSKSIRHPDHTKAMIKEKMAMDGEDSEIATCSLKVSLNCPVSKCRMTIPCRPVTCSHLQCFDAGMFLQMNERKAKWVCPVCDKSAHFDVLAIDGYFCEVLRSASSEVTDINFFDDGTWAPVVEVEKKKEKNEDAAPNLRKGASTSGAGSATPTVKIEAAGSPASPKQEAEEDDGPSKVPDCILIESSDEEEEAPPPSKRICAEPTGSSSAGPLSASSSSDMSHQNPLSPALTITPTGLASSSPSWRLSPHHAAALPQNNLHNMAASHSPFHSSSPSVNRSAPPPLTMPSLVRMNSPPLSSPTPSAASKHHPGSNSPSWRPRPAHSSAASPPAIRPRPAHLSISSSSSPPSAPAPPPTPVALTRSLTGQSYNLLSGAGGYPFYPPLPPPSATTRSPSTTSFHSHDSLSTPPGGRVSPSIGISGPSSLNDALVSAGGFLLSGSPSSGSNDGGMNGLDLRTSASSAGSENRGGGNATSLTLAHDLLGDFAGVEPFFSTHGFVGLE